MCNCKWLRLEGNGWPGFPEVTTKGYSCWHMLGRHRGSSLIPRGSSPTSSGYKAHSGASKFPGWPSYRGDALSLTNLDWLNYLLCILLRFIPIPFKLTACAILQEPVQVNTHNWKLSSYSLSSLPFPKLTTFNLLKAVTLSLKITTLLGCCT